MDIFDVTDLLGGKIKLTCEVDAQEVFRARCSELDWETTILLEFVRDSDQHLDLHKQ